MPGTRPLALVVLSALLVLAGCQGGPLGGQATATTPTPYASADSLDGQALARDHAAALNASGNYTATATLSYERIDADYPGESFTRRIRAEQRENVTLTTETFRHAGNESTVRSYTEDGAQWLRLPSGATRTQEAAARPVPRNPARLFGGTVAELVGGAEWRLNHTARRRGLVYSTYVLTDANATAYVKQFDVITLRRASNLTARLTVDERGVVRSYEASFTTTAANGDRFNATISVGTSNVGSTTVQRPAWV